MANEETPITEFPKMYPDIPLISQDDGPGNVVKIMYTPDFTLAMDMFRGVLSTGEKSQRVLMLLWAVMKLNPSNYTVWKYRRDCLQAIGADVVSELQLIAKLAITTPKNFQLWHHRRDVLLTLAPDAVAPPFDEIGLCSTILEKDAKNYHVWSHRKWCVMKYSALYEGEMAYTGALIQEDVYNNSAWNYRHFLMERDSNPAIRRSEITFALRALSLVPDNESPLTYAEAMCDIPQEGKECHRDVGMLRELYDELVEFRAQDMSSNTTMAVMWSLVELAKALGMTEATKEYATLLSGMDPVRKVFWEAF